MTESRTTNPPSPFVAGWAVRAALDAPGSRRALDVASGRGRHAVVLANAGFRVVALDSNLEALRALQTEGAGRISCACVDLTRFAWPSSRFDLVVVTRYLDRLMFDALREALVPGGLLLYETFTEHQLLQPNGPRSRAHLLAPGELRLRLRGMDVLYDEEVAGPESVARIAARRR